MTEVEGDEEDDCGCGGRWEWRKNVSWERTLRDQTMSEGERKRIAHLDRRGIFGMGRQGKSR